MLVFKHCNKNEEWHLIPNQVYTVGRKEGDITLNEDASVSRRHAKISVHLPVGNIAGLGKVVVEDLASRFNTYVNSKEIVANSPNELHIGDTIQFGRNKSSFKLHSVPLIVTTSLLPEDLKQELGANLAAIGGKLTSEWQVSTTHLVVRELTYTPKVMCALAAAKPIVTPAFFAEWKNNPSFDYHKRVMEYQPRMNEPQLSQQGVSMLPNVERSSIFNNKTFVFASAKQLKRIKMGIMLAGGRTVKLDHNLTGRLAESDIILVDWTNQHVPDNAEDTELLSRARDIIAGANKRLVLESEVGLAIAFGSASRYCNPSIDIHSQSLRTTQTTQINASLTSNAPPGPSSATCETQPGTSATQIKREPDFETECILPLPKRFKSLASNTQTVHTETEFVQSQMESKPVLVQEARTAKRKIDQDSVSAEKRHRDESQPSEASLRPLETENSTPNILPPKSHAVHTKRNDEKQAEVRDKRPSTSNLTGVTNNVKCNSSSISFTNSSRIPRNDDLDSSVTLASFLRPDIFNRLTISEPASSRSQKRFTKMIGHDGFTTVDM